MSRVGSAMVAMCANAHHVPVMVCAESHKFHDRVRMDSITSNELGDPDELVRVDQHPGICSLEGWRSVDSLGACARCTAPGTKTRQCDDMPSWSIHRRPQPAVRRNAMRICFNGLHRVWPHAADERASDFARVTRRVAAQLSLNTIHFDHCAHAIHRAKRNKRARCGCFRAFSGQQCLAAVDASACIPSLQVWHRRHGRLASCPLQPLGNIYSARSGRWCVRCLPTRIQGLLGASCPHGREIS